MMYKAKPTSEFIQGRLYNCHVCVSILIHFVLHKIITFRFAKALHFVLPDLLSSIATGKMANVELSFDIAKNGTDNVTVTVEIEGDGRVVGGETPLLSAAFVPINNADKTKNWQWNSHKVTIKGVTANTKIIIRSTQWKTSGYHRWFLDNIKLTRVNING